MQDTSNVTNYDSLFLQNARRQIQVIIYKTSQTHYTFGEDKIISCSTSAALFSKNTFSLGGCVAKRLNLRFYPGANRTNIPPMAKVKLQLRLTDGTTTSDWINKGTFFVDTRKYDQMTGIMELECFDAMLKSEEYYIQNDDNTWPRRMRAVATDIATRMGLTIENANLIPNNDDYLVQLPMDYSMREILANIGVACGGNWIVKDSGDKLRFCSVGYSGGEADIGKQCSSFTIGDQFDTFSKVIMNLDDNTYVEAGDATGRTLEVYCAWGNQNICTALLGIVSHLYHPYRPYNAKNAYINPAMELGDYIDVTASGSSVAYLVASIDMNYDALCLADLSAPTDDEIDHEYPTQTPTMQEVARQVRTAEASISVLSSEITLKVDSNGVIAAINASPETITISAGKVDLSGYVSFSQIGSQQSQTFIDGGNIITGTISADTIDVSNLHVQKVYFNAGTTQSPDWKVIAIGASYSGAGGNGVDTLLGYQDPNKYSHVEIMGDEVDVWDGVDHHYGCVFNVHDYNALSLYPYPTNVWSLGTMNNRFKKLWVTDINASGTIYSTGNIESASGNIIVSGSNKRVESPQVKLTRSASSSVLLFCSSNKLCYEDANGNEYQVTATPL